MIGQTISHYKILEKLGEGGMGIGTATSSDGLTWSSPQSIGINYAFGEQHTNPAIFVQSNFFGYHGGYFVSTWIEPGKAYWVKVSQKGQLVLTASRNIPKNPHRSHDN